MLDSYLEDRNGITHWMPAEDIRPHTRHNCECEPFEVYDSEKKLLGIIHSSWDCREAIMAIRDGAGFEESMGMRGAYCKNVEIMYEEKEIDFSKRLALKLAIDFAINQRFQTN